VVDSKDNEAGEVAEADGVHRHFACRFLSVKKTNVGVQAMWDAGKWDDDRVLFVLAVFTAIAIILGPRIARFQQAIAVGRLNIKLHSIIVAVITLLIILVFGSQIWHHWPSPAVTGLIAILLGAIFGSFAARFVPTLFSTRFGRRDPIIGAGVLLLLSIGYSFPLYSSALSDLIGRIGLSSVKTPFLELTLRERGSKSFTYSASGTNPQGGAPRPSDPVPGLRWLSLDTTFAADPAADPTDDDYYISFLNSTLPSDEDYIGFFDPGLSNGNAHNEDVEQVKKLLAPATVLSTCLQEYINVFPDSGLLLVDVKPVIESLFTLHTRAKKDLQLTRPELHYSPEDTSIFLKDINGVLQQVTKKFQRLALANQLVKCQTSDPIGAGTIDYRQPYTALVLADLIHAHGSPDEAIAVLAEWLDMLDSYWRKNGEDAGVSKWWYLRIMSRISILMAEVAGENNLAYREFFDAYKKEMENFFEKKRNITLGHLAAAKFAKCNWPAAPVGRLARDVAKARSKRSDPSSKQLLDGLVEQKAFYLLLEAEDESLRTEINFVGDEGKIPNLESLYARAAFLASVGKECLPGYFTERQRNGTIADHQVTAGLLELTIADRMATVAVSRADNERSAEITRDGEKTLRDGYHILSSYVEEDRNTIKRLDWHHRVFAQPEWEKSASLGARAVLRLK
jgi:hypothetical protein